MPTWPTIGKRGWSATNGTRKAIWLALFPIFQLTRPPRLKAITMRDRWFVVNLVCAALYDVAVIYFFGWAGFLYLVFSFFFSVGLHPVGARWIQEHYTNDPEQETYSYYGPINRVCLNMGYHNEHHDFPSIPWNNLAEAAGDGARVLQPFEVPLVRGPNCFSSSFSTSATPCFPGSRG